MDEQEPQIELYVSAGDDEQNTAIEHMLESLQLTQVIKQTLQRVGITVPVMLTLMITDDEAIRDMNKQYRQQNKPTDVLSFPLLEKPLVDAPVEQLWQPAVDAEGQPISSSTPSVFVTPPELITNLGDIVISWPTVSKQAAEAGHSTAYELLYLVVHGVLHLVGYDDQNEAGYQTMVHIQQTVLQTMGQKA